MTERQMICRGQKWISNARNRSSGNLIVIMAFLGRECVCGWVCSMNGVGYLSSHRLSVKFYRLIIEFQWGRWENKIIIKERYAQGTTDASEHQQNNSGSSGSISNIDEARNAYPPSMEQRTDWTVRMFRPSVVGFQLWMFLESLDGRRCNGSGCVGRFTLPTYYVYGNQMLPFVSFLFLFHFFSFRFWKTCASKLCRYTLIWNELHVVMRVKVSRSRTRQTNEKQFKSTKWTRSMLTW